jgi:Superinfection immunity protein
VLSVYFIPTIVAAARHHHNAIPIILVNVLLGWSCIGWIVALVWSFTSPAPVAQQVVYNYPPENRPPPTSGT